MLLNDGQYKKTQLMKKETIAELLRFQFTEANKPKNVDLKKLNSGIFWATKLNATRIGHNGANPGVRTFMLADVSKEIGVIVFFNTTLTDSEEGTFFDIYQAIHEYAVNLKKQ
jgi:hypothetical protein